MTSTTPTPTAILVSTNHLTRVLTYQFSNLVDVSTLPFTMEAATQTAPDLAALLTTQNREIEAPMTMEGKLDKARLQELVTWWGQVSRDQAIEAAKQIQNKLVPITLSLEEVLDL